MIIPEGSIRERTTEILPFSISLFNTKPEHTSKPRTAFPDLFPHIFAVFWWHVKVNTLQCIFVIQEVPSDALVS